MIIPLNAQSATVSKLYSAWGLAIDSSIELPLLQLGDGVAADVTIRFGTVPETLDNARHQGVCFQAFPGRFLLKLENIARYLVSDGCEILIDPVPDAESDAIRLFLLGSAIGALLHQRSILPLHASAIRVNEGVVAFAGNSGVGKSTLAASFMKNGCQVVADDICAVSVASGVPLVCSGSPNLKLWHDALHQLGEDPQSLPRVRDSVEKYRLPLAHGFAEEVLPLRKLYVLRSINQDRFELEHLTGVDKLNALVKNTYRFNFLKGLGGKKEHFSHCAAVGRHVDVCRVSRGKNGFRIEELMALLEEDFNR